MKKKYFGINMKNYDQTGFTLIEVMLYLALVGLVILIGMNAVGGRSAQVQFTDSMRDLHGYVTSQYSEFVSGVKPYDIGCQYTTPPTPIAETPSLGTGTTSDGSCVLFGKVFMFEDDLTGDDQVISVYNLVARNLDNNTTELYSDNNQECSSVDLSCLDPYVIEFSGITVQTHQILWGTRFIGGNESNHGYFGNSSSSADLLTNRQNDNVRGFGWLKEPITNRTIPVVFGGVTPFTSTSLSGVNIYKSHARAQTLGTSPITVAMGSEFNSAFCFEGPNDQHAMLIFGEGESQEVINLTFAETVRTHDCSTF